jgi:2-dehydro-3-deoxyphosphogluconate aldolase/(4S)-4-hydroxy-2-oxoglutarate aldolase
MSAPTLAGPIAIVRSMVPLTDPVEIFKILSNSGLHLVEITLNTPGALAAINLASAAGLAVGAGTVCSRDDALRARDAGARFLVTPGLVAGAADAGLPLLMGAYTASEAMQALQLGAQAVKLFPANLLSPAYAQALLAPLPQLRLIPTGGIAAAGFAAWRAAGCVGVGIGSELRIAEPVGLAERARACALAWGSL